MIAEAKTTQEYLVRIGLYGEPLRCWAQNLSTLDRQQEVVVQTDRGPLLASILRPLTLPITPGEKLQTEPPADAVWIARIATADDFAQRERLQQQALQDFSDWKERLIAWKIQMELIDLEWTLDGKRLMLYVLNERGPEPTKLALQAAAVGFDYIDVLPVTANGLLPSPISAAKAAGNGGGCGCGSGGGCHS